jgi:hypothetical protein
MKIPGKVLNVRSVDWLFRREEPRLTSMVNLLVAEPPPHPDFPRISRKPRSIPAGPLHCIALLPFIRSKHETLSSRPPRRGSVHSWLALAETSRGQVFSVLLHRAPSGDNWVIASIMQGETTRKLRRVVKAVPQPDRSQLWLASIPHLRFLCVVRPGGKGIRVQVLEKGLSSLREGGLYGGKTVKARVAADELRISEKHGKMRSMAAASPARSSS